MKKRGALFLTLFAAALVAGCGGGGSSPSSPAAVATATAAPLIPMTFTIAVSRDPQSARRSQYISPSTQSIGGSVSPVAGGTPITAVGNCASPATTCQLQLLAPVGLDAFTLSLYDQPNGTGNLLSTGNTTLQVIAGDTHQVEVTFNGLPATLKLLVTPSTAVYGTASSGSVLVVAKDAGGNIILGPGAFNPPINLTVSDPTGSVALGSSQLTNPSGPQTSYQFNGSASAPTTVTFTASMTGLASSTATLTIVPGPPTPSPAPTATPVPTPTPTPLPTGVPTPVPTPTASPGFALLCSYTISQGNGTVVTKPCNTSVVTFTSGLPTTIDFNFTNGHQGALLGGLKEQVGGATGWTEFTNGFNPVRITIGAQFPPGQATLVVTDGFGGYFQVGVNGT